MPGLRWAERFAVAYAAVIAIGSVAWNHAAAQQPGAWSILLMGGLALFGVLLVALRIRSAANAPSEQFASAMLFPRRALRRSDQARS
jgi:MYXO-CTERM domain-containing protein